MTAANIDWLSLAAEICRPARLCDDCGEREATETWDYSDAPIPAAYIPAPDHYCEQCADRRRDRYQEILNSGEF